jgi:glycosyltransferase involved in cell wall biosynthesis
MISLIVPLYRSEPNLERLFAEVVKLQDRLPEPLELVLVNDGSPDNCAAVIRDRLPHLPLQARVVHLSRNFGSFAAIAAGLREGTGDRFAAVAADLQEPPELVISFSELLQRGDIDVVFGYRRSRQDPVLSAFASNLFWAIYRKTVNPDIPKGGVDVFACTRQVRDQLIALRELDTNLVAVLFWIGFRRAFVPYDRLPRTEGRSAWTLARRLRYSINSIFSFTDIPIQFLLACGAGGTLAGGIIAVAVLIARFTGHIQVSGYTALMIAIIFFGSITTFGMGVVGQYLWLSLQLGKQRPPFVVREVERYDGRVDHNRAAPACLDRE